MVQLPDDISNLASFEKEKEYFGKFYFPEKEISRRYSYIGYNLAKSKGFSNSLGVWKLEALSLSFSFVSIRSLPATLIKKGSLVKVFI